MRAKRFSLGGAIIAAWAPLQGVAHHSFAAEFNVNEPIRLTGTLTRVEFTNPHCWLYVDVTTASGAIEHWSIEGGAPNVLIRRGWKRDSVRPGVVVTVLGYRARDSALRASGSEIRLSDGSFLFIGSR